MLSKVKKNNKGFTIIEVMIVLAIAALILLIVFLAVPALQRNSRNTARKGDVSRISAAVTEFLSNNNGTLPAVGAAGTATTDAAAIANNAGNLSQYDFKTGTAAEDDKLAVIDLTSGAAANPTDTTKITIVRKAKCSGTAGAAVTGTNRQTAILYSTESSGATPNNLCIDQ